jgi:hypothetical protein
MKRLKFQNILFIAILVVIAFLFNQPKYIDHPPRSAHQWRQSDAYSITLNYYNDGMDFFKPSIHLQQSDGGKAVGEFPIIYYFDALIWKITGPSFLVIRLVNLLIAFCGLFALFKLVGAITKDRFFSFAIPILLYSSPVFGYYSNSFLVNIDALSFLFIAWWFFYRFENSGRWLHLFVALLFITLSGLLRTTMLIGFVPIVIWFVYRWRNNDKNIRWILLRTLILVLPIVLISIWIIFTTQYNAKYHSTYFLTTIRPVWEASNPAKIWSKFNYEALSNLFPAFLRILFLLMIIGLIMIAQTFRNRWIWFSLIVFAELIVYSLLWYQNLDFHDYYLIEFLILIPVVLIAVILYIKERWSEIFLSRKFRAIVSVSLVFLLFYGAARTRIKYDKKAFFFTHMFLTENEIRDWGNFHWYYDRSIKPFETIDPYLDSIGVKHTDLVVSLPDPSSNITLSLMDRKGYSMMYMDRKEVRDSLPSFIDKGAIYLVIYDHRDVECGFFKEFTQRKIGTYQNVQIFQLK